MEGDGAAFSPSVHRGNSCSIPKGNQPPQLSRLFTTWRFAVNPRPPPTPLPTNRKRASVTVITNFSGSDDDQIFRPLSPLPHHTHTHTTSTKLVLSLHRKTIYHFPHSESFDPFRPFASNSSYLLTALVEGRMDRLAS